MLFNVINALGWAAQEVAQNGGADVADQATKNPGPLGNPLFLVAVIVALFYFMIIRPQKRDQRQRQTMLESMKKGDRVVSAGGIHGTIESIDTDKGIVTVSVAPKVNMKFAKASITTVIDKNAKDSDTAEGGK